MGWDGRGTDEGLGSRSDGGHRQDGGGPVGWGYRWDEVDVEVNVEVDVNE